MIDDEIQDDFNDRLYQEAKDHWDNFFRSLAPRNSTEEEHNGFDNALEDWIADGCRVL